MLEFLPEARLRERLSAHSLVGMVGDVGRKACVFVSGKEEKVGYKEYTIKEATIVCS